MVRFLDANIPMYAAGAEHPLQDPSRLVIIDAARNSKDLTVGSLTRGRQTAFRYRVLFTWVLLAASFLTLTFLVDSETGWRRTR